MRSSYVPNAPKAPVVATVYAINPPNQLICIVDGWGGGSRIPVRMLSPGQCDAIRVQQVPLPKVGSKGIVVFAHQNSQNGFWLGSFSPNLMNAYPNSTDPDTTYTSENSGFWSLRDGKGNQTIAYADGSVFTAANEEMSPPTRQIVQNNVASRQVAGPRSVTTQPPIKFQLITSSGVTIDVDGQNVTVENTDGSIFNINGNQITLTAPGGLTINANVQVNGILNATTDVTTNNVSLKNHLHSDPQGGDVSPPIPS